MPTGKVPYHWKFCRIKNTETLFRYDCIMIGIRASFFSAFLLFKVLSWGGF